MKFITALDNLLFNYLPTTESLIGYYKYPYNCDHNTIGPGLCKYLVMWFKTAAPDEIRFAIAAKDVESTAIGFSTTKDVVSKQVSNITHKLFIILQSYFKFN